MPTIRSELSTAELVSIALLAGLALAVGGAGVASAAAYYGYTGTFGAAIVGGVATVGAAGVNGLATAGAGLAVVAGAALLATGGVVGAAA